MKTKIILQYLASFIALFLVFLLIIIFFQYSHQKDKTSSGSYPTLLKTNQTPFYWGVTTGGYVFNTYDQPFTPNHLAQQMPYIKDLKVNVVRFAIEHHGNVLSNDVNDAVIKSLTQNNIERYAGVGEPVDDIYTQGTYQIGYDWGYKIAKQYKGKIQFYQLSNELSGMTLKPNYPGDKESDYDESKYQPVKNYLDGLSHGIHAADPEAKRIVTANWLGVGVIDKLVQDNVPFDIVGWDWYSDMGDNPTHKVLDDGTVLDIPKYLSKYHKPFWIVEANADHGNSKLGNTGQAKYLQTLTDNILKSKEVNGFIVYQLFDISHVNSTGDGLVPTTEDDQWGLIKASYNKMTKEIEPGQIKPAFTTYKNIIKSNLNQK